MNDAKEPYTTATLVKWRLQVCLAPNEKRYVVAKGRIYDDKLERFPDGAELTTSAITLVDFERGLCFTRNSVYKLEDAASLEKDNTRSKHDASS